METILFLLLIVSLAVAAFCAGAETGFLSVSRGRILHMVRLGSARAKLVQSAISNMARTTTTLLIGNNMAAVTYSAVSAALSTRFFPDSSFGQFLWSAFAAVLMLAGGEFLPKLLCSARPLRRLLQVMPAWSVLSRALTPIVAVVDAVIVRFLPRREQKARITPVSMLKILEDRKDGVKLSELESALISRLMVLRAKGEFVTPESLLSALAVAND